MSYLTTNRSSPQRLGPEAELFGAQREKLFLSVLFQMLKLQLVLSCSAGKGLALPPAELPWLGLVPAGSLGNVSAKTAEISARN